MDTAWGEEARPVVSRDGGRTLATVGKKVGRMMVSVAAQGLEVAISCRGGIAEPGVHS